MREITYTEALMEAFREEMRRDQKVFHLCGGLGTGRPHPGVCEERVRLPHLRGSLRRRQHRRGG